MPSIEECRVKELERLHDYQEVFASPRGQKVWADMKRRFLAQMTSKAHAEAGNGVGLGYIAGQRELILIIQNWVECDAVERVDALYPEQEKEPAYGESEPYKGTEWFTGDQA